MNVRIHIDNAARSDPLSRDAYRVQLGSSGAVLRYWYRPGDANSEARARDCALAAAEGARAMALAAGLGADVTDSTGKEPA